MEVKIVECPVDETIQNISYMSLFQLMERFFQEHPEIDEMIRNENSGDTYAKRRYDR